MLAPGAAQAEYGFIWNRPMPDVPFYNRGFLAVEGGYLFNGSDRNLSFDPADSRLGLFDPMRPGRDGGTLGVSFGWTLTPEWDWKIGYRANLLGSSNVSRSTQAEIPFIITTFTRTTNASATNRFYFQHVDLEVGYRPMTLQNLWQRSAIRLFAGPRIVNAQNRIDYGVDESDKLGTFSGSYQHDVSLWGFGPRAGLDASIPICDSPFSLNFGGAGSVLFSRVDHRFDFNTVSTSGPNVDTTSGSTNSRFWRTVYNAEGSLSLSYRIVPAVAVSAGYRASQWWGLSTTIGQANSSGGFATGRGNILTHGPFVRFTFELP